MKMRKGKRQKKKRGTDTKGGGGYRWLHGASKSRKYTYSNGIIYRARAECDKQRLFCGGILTLGSFMTSSEVLEVIMLFLHEGSTEGRKLLILCQLAKCPTCI